MITRMVSESMRIKSKGLPIDISDHLSYVFYMHNVAYKSKWLPIDIPSHLSHTFYTCNAAYKKQGASN
jgi:hypothetical protein